MSLLNMAKGHLRTITTNDAIGFAQDVTFTTPDGLTSLTVKALFTSHSHGYDTEGIEVTAKIASVAVDESLLNENGYVTRNGAGVVFLEGHRIVTADSTGNDRSYIVTDRKPDNELGLIVLMLNEFSE